MSAILTERLKPVRAWLERVHARALWTLGDSNDDDNWVTAYEINGHVCLLHVSKWPIMTEGDWGLYVLSSKCNNTAATLDEAAEYCGVEGCCGLVPGEETDGER